MDTSEPPRSQPRTESKNRRGNASHSGAQRPQDPSQPQQQSRSQGQPAKSAGSANRAGRPGQARDNQAERAKSRPSASEAQPVDDSHAASSSNHGSNTNPQPGAQARQGQRSQSSAQHNSAPLASASAPSSSPDAASSAQDGAQQRSQSQKRKDRRKNAERKRQEGTAPSNGADSGHSTSPAPAAATRASEPTSSGNASSSSRHGGGGGGQSFERGAGGRKQQRDPMALAKEDYAALSGPKKLQNLSGFGDDISDDGYGAPSKSLRSLTSSAEYVPSSQRGKNQSAAAATAQPRFRHAQDDELAPKRLDLTLAVEGQTELASKIISELVGNRYECDICFNTIRRSVAVWSCNHCHSIFHVVCAKKWAKSARDPNAPPNALIGRWHCPKCRHGHDGVPNSWCFCGKVKDPANDPMKVPHSCGDVCLKPRSGTTCPHTCPLQCHPGPCPPCASMGPLKHCWCQRATYRLRCGQHDEGQTCGNVCDKPLACGRHRCTSVCHPGACAPCAKQVDQTCYCGKVTATRTCGAADEREDLSQGSARFFSCHDVCERTLDCGQHKCTRTCHTGPCDPCKLQPNIVKTCGCGAQPILSLTGGVARTSCLDPIPSCKSVCHKMRACGHRCTNTCHPGECAPCEVEIQLPCRCHTTTKPLKCCDVFPNAEALTAAFTCERACGRQKACGKHVCSVRCCPSFHNRTDPDGYHVCRVSCNKRLNCGKHLCKQPCHKGKCGRCLEANFNDVICPCGKTIQEAPIVCGTPALVCPHPCSKQRPCGHSASTHQCHEGDCPPCLIPMEMPCAGGHTVMLNIPCYKRNMSCGVACNKPMACGLHNCKKQCHAGPCEPPLPEGVELAHGTRHSCGQPCKAPLYTCSHTCLALCHPGQPCPEEECRQLLRVTCDCGVVSAEIPCPGKEKKVLPCTAACESARRRKQLADAFGMYGTATTAPRYPDLLINMACVAPMFVSRIERWLDDFVKTPATVTRQDLPPLDRVQRQCVHELAKFYGLGTESSGSDDRKQRAITLTKRKDSKAPSVALTTVANVTGIHDSNNGGNPSSVSSGQHNLFLDSAPSSTLHIYDLHKGILTGTLHSFLSGFPNEYTLQWVDDENCLAIFSDPNRMQRALNQLQPRGTFKVKPYQDVNPDLTSGMVSLGSTSSAAPSAWKDIASTASITAPKVKTSAESGYKPQSVWTSRGNPFSVLDPSSPSHHASSSSASSSSHVTASTSRTLDQRSLMMWNLGESEKTVPAGFQAEIAAPRHETPLPAPSTSPAREVPSNWMDLEEESDAPSTPTTTTSTEAPSSAN